MKEYKFTLSYPIKYDSIFLKEAIIKTNTCLNMQSIVSGITIDAWLKITDFLLCYFIVECGNTIFTTAVSTNDDLEQWLIDCYDSDEHDQVAYNKILLSSSTSNDWVKSTLNTHHDNLSIVIENDKVYLISKNDIPAWTIPSLLDALNEYDNGYFNLPLREAVENGDVDILDYMEASLNGKTVQEYIASL